VSGSKEMAKLGLDYCKSITINSPALNRRVDVLQYSLRYKTKKTTNILKALPAVADRLNGLRPHFCCIDELHIMKDNSLTNIIKTGQVGIKNSLTSITTTRGMNITYYQYQYEQYLKRVLDEEVEDDNTFIMIFSLDDESEIQNTEMWVKANPCLLNPEVLPLSSLLNLYNQSRSSISDLRSFVVLNLNWWYETAEDSFIPTEQLDKVFVQEIDEDLIRDEECFMGVDLSSTKDITSISLIFPPSDKHDKFIIKNWNIKTNAVERRVRRGGIDLTEHIKSGDLIELKSKRIDYDYLFNLIDKLSDRYHIKIAGYDRHNSVLIMTRMENNLRIPVQDVPQTAKFLNMPMKYLEILIFEEQVIIDNQVTKWMFQNTSIYIDGNGNIKPMKDRSLDSIDSVVAICNGMAVYLESIGHAQFGY
jgi:phage terminase large subunit-like protein